MAKRANDSSNQKQNSSLRVRWVEVELNGSDYTIEEALKTVERMRRPVVEPNKRMESIDMPSANGIANSESESAKEVPNEAQFVPRESARSDSEDPNSDPPRRKRGEGERTDRNAGIELVGDVNFIPSGKQALKELFTQKAPGSDLDQVLVICYFLQHTLKLSPIGAGHILSGFKHVGKPVPKDLKQTIRNMKKNKAWLNFSNVDDLRLTTEGDNRVEHELGKSKPD